MTTKSRIDDLWDELQMFLTRAYESAEVSADDKHAIRNYVPNQTWFDALDKLLETEKANEKQHRGTRSVKDFSATTAAKLILMGNFADGAEKTEMPPATNFLVYLKTAAEAQLVGYLIRSVVLPTWIQLVREFDYAKLMKAA